MRRVSTLLVTAAVMFTALFFPVQSLAQEAAAPTAAAVDHTAGDAVSKVFVQYVLPVLATGIAGLLAVMLTALTTWLKSKASGNKLFDVLARATHLAEVVVHELEATIRAELLEASKDGVLTDDEKKRIKETAIARLKALLGSTGVEELQSVLGLGVGQLEQYLAGLIEKAVSKLPESNPGPMTALAGASAGNP